MALTAHVDGGGPPVVLLHGLGGAARNWDEIVPRLVDRYRVVALDLPGHGSSPRTAAPGLAGVRGRGGAGDRGGAALLRRSSWGTRSGDTWLPPSRRDGRTSFEGFCSSRRPVSGRSRAERGSSSGRRRPSGPAACPPASALGLHVASGSGGSSFDRSSSRTPALSLRTLRTASSSSCGTTPTRERRASRCWQTTRVSRLPRSAAPRSSLWGARDAQLPLDDAFAYARRLGARLRVVADCGHLVIGERPEAVVDSLDALAAECQ